MYKGDKNIGEIELLKEVKVFENRFCEFFNDEVAFPSGVNGNFLRLAMKGKFSVAVLPVTKDGKMIFIKTFRHSARSWGYEVPKGYGQENQDHKDCALKELKEETGYTSSNLIDLGIYHEAPSTIMYGLHCYIALDCEKVSDLDLEDTETIEGTIEVSALEELQTDGYKDAITEMLVAKYLYLKNK